MKCANWELPGHSAEVDTLVERGGFMICVPCIPHYEGAQHPMDAAREIIRLLDSIETLLYRLDAGQDDVLRAVYELPR